MKEQQMKALEEMAKMTEEMQANEEKMRRFRRNQEILAEQQRANQASQAGSSSDGLSERARSKQPMRRDDEMETDSALRLRLLATPLQFRNWAICRSVILNHSLKLVTS